MAPELFVDTSAWYPLADRRHPRHDSLAATLAERVARSVRVVTTNMVVAETHALLLRRGGRAVALRFLDEVRRDPILVEYATPDLEERAVSDWLQPFEDQDFSLTDAVSFAVMKERQIIEALTLDDHFSVAGFTVLPES